MPDSLRERRGRHGREETNLEDLVRLTQHFDVMHVTGPCVEPQDVPMQFRHRNAFYEPIVSDWANYGQWVEEGSRDATQRVNETWKRVLAEFEPPPLGDAVAAELEFVARHTAEGGAPPES